MSSAFLIESKELGFVVETDVDGVQREVYALKNDKPVHVSSRTIARWEQPEVRNGPTLEELKARSNSSEGRSPSSRSPSHIAAPAASPRTVLRPLEVTAVDARASDREAPSPTSPLRNNSFMQRDAKPGATSSCDVEAGAKISSDAQPNMEAGPAVAPPASIPAPPPPASTEAEAASAPAEAATAPRSEAPVEIAVATEAITGPSPAGSANRVARPDLVVRLPSARIFADFVAEGEGELSVTRDEELLVLPRKAPRGWAVVRRAASDPGMDEGLVPADWLELEGGASKATHADAPATDASGPAAAVASAREGEDGATTEIGGLGRQGSRLTRSVSWSKVLARKLSWNRRSRSSSNTKAGMP